MIFDRQGRLFFRNALTAGSGDCPEAHVEIGESLGEGVAREVREENGLTVVSQRLIGLYSSRPFRSCAIPTATLHYVSVCFECGSAAANSRRATKPGPGLGEAGAAAHAAPEPPDPHRDARARRVTPFVR